MCLVLSQFTGRGVLYFCDQLGKARFNLLYVLLEPKHRKQSLCADFPNKVRPTFGISFDEVDEFMDVLLLRFLQICLNLYTLLLLFVAGQILPIHELKCRNQP